MNTADVIPASVTCPACSWPMTPAHLICSSCETAEQPIDIDAAWREALAARLVEAALWS